MGGGWFFTFFWTPVSQKQFEISKCTKGVNYWKFQDLQIWFDTFFRYLIRFLRYFEKKMFFEKTLSDAWFLRFPKTFWIGSNNVFFSFFYCWESSLPWTARSRDNVSAKLGVGWGCFLDISSLCISKTVGHIKTNMEVWGRLRPHFFPFRICTTVKLEKISTFKNSFFMLSSCCAYVFMAEYFWFWVVKG